MELSYHEIQENCWDGCIKVFIESSTVWFNKIPKYQGPRIDQCSSRATDTLGKYP